MHSWPTRNHWCITPVPLQCRLPLKTSRVTSPLSSLVMADSKAQSQTSSLSCKSSPFSVRNSLRPLFLMSKNCCRCHELWPLFLSCAKSKMLPTFCQLLLDFLFNALVTLPCFSLLPPIIKAQEKLCHLCS